MDASTLSSMPTLAVTDVVEVIAVPVMTSSLASQLMGSLFFELSQFTITSDSVALGWSSPVHDMRLGYAVVYAVGG